jgi:hypothetical protein
VGGGVILKEQFVPDEQSNLNMPATPRRSGGRPGGRRRGRRGGRGRARGPRPAAEKPEAAAEELPLAPEPAGEEALSDAIAEPETDTSGDFREPHPEEPFEPAAAGETSPLPSEPLAEPSAETTREAGSEPEPVSEASSAPEAAPEPEPARERPPVRPPQAEPRRPEPRPWSKPADFRPADVSAITQAVAHATEIAESLKHTLDQLDEILELVELAERQKIADEREIDELRRALRRIQQPRHLPSPHLQRGPRHDEPHRGHREHNPRPEESRQVRQESQESDLRSGEPPRTPEAGEPPTHID